MIKKMWAILTNNSVVGFCDKEKIEARCFACRKNNNEIKPVWVSDRDPFENVRRVRKICEVCDAQVCEECETYDDTIQALEKDLKNFDEGAG